MDRWTSLAVNLILFFLNDRKELVKARAAMVKVFRTIAAVYERDEEFQRQVKDITSSSCL